MSKMDLHEIRRVMDRAANALGWVGGTVLAEKLSQAEQAVEEEVAMTWTLGDALADIVRETHPGHPALVEWDAQNKTVREILAEKEARLP